MPIPTLPFPLLVSMESMGITVVEVAMDQALVMLLGMVEVDEDA